MPKMSKIVITIDYEHDSWPQGEGADVELQLEDAVTSILVQRDVMVDTVTVEHR